MRVLVADDCEMNRLLARSLLTKAGCEVSAVEDGQAACAAVASGRFDLVFMDCDMPVLDGLSATREIRRRELESSAERVVIVALTASDEPEQDRSRCLEAGMDDFVRKPLRRDALKDALLRHTRSAP
jgi:CheY-like chemotaxis protein